MISAAIAMPLPWLRPSRPLQQHDDRHEDRRDRQDARAAEERQDQRSDRQSLAGLLRAGRVRTGGRPVDPAPGWPGCPVGGWPYGGLAVGAAGRAGGGAAAGSAGGPADRTAAAGPPGRQVLAAWRARGGGVGAAGSAAGRGECRTGSAGPAACRRLGSAECSSGSPRVPPWSMPECSVPHRGPARRSARHRVRDAVARVGSWSSRCGRPADVPRDARAAAGSARSAPAAARSSRPMASCRMPTPNGPTAAIR